MGKKLSAEERACIDGWNDVFADSGWTLKSLADLVSIDHRSFKKYLDYHRFPRVKNLEKMEIAMLEAKKTPRIKFHPSYGYATEEQIRQLKTMGVCIERDMLLKKIEEQTKKKGKYV